MEAYHLNGYGRFWCDVGRIPELVNGTEYPAEKVAEDDVHPRDKHAGFD
jgi:hypothetical protein